MPLAQAIVCVMGPAPQACLCQPSGGRDRTGSQMHGLGGWYRPPHLHLPSFLCRWTRTPGQCLLPAPLWLSASRAPLSQGLSCLRGPPRVWEPPVSRGLLYVVWSSSLVREEGEAGVPGFARLEQRLSQQWPG